jgi:bifunctional DNA-binding transcriptional regulator/antitoxin component of YhaV-PrlF toxin-antitoxin module
MEMYVMTYSATITSKGQITIPRAARLALNSSTVDIEVQGNLVVLRPVLSVAGSLAAYRGGAESPEEIRGNVWQDVADEKAAKA